MRLFVISVFKNEIMHYLASSEFITLLRIYLGTSRIDELPDSFSYKELSSQARTMGLVPILYLNPARKLFSAEFQQALKRAFLLTLAHYDRLARTLLTLCAAFHERSIEAVPFKGIMLSKQLYGDVHFRFCTDLDFMVKRADALRAVAVLLECGFQFSLLEPQQDLKALVKRVYSLEFRHPESGVLVDLQWDIANGYCPRPLPEKDFFRATTKIVIENQPIPAFQETITLYLLCVHGANNSWCELRSLLDLAMVMKNGEESLWRETLDLMKSQGLATMMTTGVLLANRLFGVAIPAAVEKDMGQFSQRLAKAIQAHWGQAGQERPGAWKRFFWNLLFRKGMREKMRYFSFRLQPTKTDIRGKRGRLVLYAGRLARIMKFKSV